MVLSRYVVCGLRWFGGKKSCADDQSDRLSLYKVLDLNQELSYSEEDIIFAYCKLRTQIKNNQQTNKEFSDPWLMQIALYVLTDQSRKKDYDTQSASLSKGATTQQLKNNLINATTNHQAESQKTIGQFHDFCQSVWLFGYDHPSDCFRDAPNLLAQSVSTIVDFKMSPGNFHCVYNDQSEIWLIIASEEKYDTTECTLVTFTDEFILIKEKYIFDCKGKIYHRIVEKYIASELQSSDVCTIDKDNLQFSWQHSSYSHQEAFDEQSKKLSKVAINWKEKNSTLEVSVINTSTKVSDETVSTKKLTENFRYDHNHKKYSGQGMLLNDSACEVEYTVGTDGVCRDREGCFVRDITGNFTLDGEVVKNQAGECIPYVVENSRKLSSSVTANSDKQAGAASNLSVSGCEHSSSQHVLQDIQHKQNKNKTLDISNKKPVSTANTDSSVTTSVTIPVGNTNTMSSATSLISEGATLTGAVTEENVCTFNDILNRDQDRTVDISNNKPISAANTESSVTNGVAIPVDCSNISSNSLIPEVAVLTGAVTEEIAETLDDAIISEHSVHDIDEGMRQDEQITDKSGGCVDITQFFKSFLIFLLMIVTFGHLPKKPKEVCTANGEEVQEFVDDKTSDTLSASPDQCNVVVGGILDCSKSYVSTQPTGVQENSIPLVACG